MVIVAVILPVKLAGPEMRCGHINFTTKQVSSLLPYIKTQHLADGYKASGTGVSDLYRLWHETCSY